MKQLCKENLEETIHNLEAMIQDHEKAYKEHPMFLGNDIEPYNHKERAEDLRQLLGYLEELKHFRKKETT